MHQEAWFNNFEEREVICYYHKECRDKRGSGCTHCIPHKHLGKQGCNVFPDGRNVCKFRCVPISEAKDELMRWRIRSKQVLGN